MKHLDNIHTDRFYTDLVDNAFLIHEVVEGETQSGEVQTYYDFEDAEDEASYDGAELSEYGNAYYFTNDKIYGCVIHLENMECTGVNLYDDPNEIKSFVQELLSIVQDDEDELLDQNPWAKKYLVKENNNSMEQKNLKFEGNFGTINLTVESDGYAMGQYQDGGILEGDFIDGEFKGEWRNKGMEGLVQFTVLDGQLNGSWKKGLDKGPMRGKWEGTLIDEAKDTTEEESTVEWNIIHDIFSFYTFFANLANEGSQEVENNFVQSEIKKWQFEINSVKYGMDNGNPQNFISLADSVFNALYMLGDSPNKDPFIQLNESHSNLAGYFNKGILNCSMISTLWSSMIKLCQLRGVTEWQDQQLRWYLEQWSSVCPDLSKLTAILDLGVVKNDMAEAIGLEFDEKYHEAKEIILSEGAALPEILCDVLLIGKNRAERIFDQFERDGIVSPKDENGKRKIIQS